MRLGARDTAAVRYLLGAPELAAAPAPTALPPGSAGSPPAAAYFTRAQPSLTVYDSLLDAHRSGDTTTSAEVTR